MHRLTLVVTHQCNFDCDYCLQCHEDKAMSFETAKTAVDELKKRMLFEQSIASSVHLQGAVMAGVPAPTAPQNNSCRADNQAQISFYGGEPLLQKDLIRQVVNYSYATIGQELGAKVLYEITTNGTLLDEDFIEFAKKRNILLALSHDGVAQDPVRHDRGGNPTREKVDEKLDLMLSHFPGTIIMMTVHPKYAGTVSESIRFFHEKGVRTVNITLAHGGRVDWTDECFEVLSSEMEKVEAMYEEWNRGEEQFRIVPFENKIRKFICQKDSDNPTCHFGRKKVMVDVDGKYYPCNHFIGKEEFAAGDLASGIDVAKLRDLESRRIEPEDCKECAIRSRCHHTCACANHGHTGCLDKVSALQCEYEKLIIRLADKAASELIRPENTAFVERMYKE